MHITLSPIRMDTPLAAVRAGDTLILNGVAHDLAALPEGQSWVASAERVAGVWHVVLLLPHGPDAPGETLYPAPVVIQGDGPVSLPPFDADPAPDTGGDLDSMDTDAPPG